MNSLIALPILFLTLNPSSNFDLSKMELVLPLPLGGAGKPIKINNQELNGNPAEDTGYSNPPYFYTDKQTGAMVFFTPINGSSTPGTKYARSELTEDKKYQWMLNQHYKINSLTATVEINQLPANNTVIIGQIHDRGDTDVYGNSVINLPLLKLIYSSNDLVHGLDCHGCVFAEILETPSPTPRQQVNLIIKKGIKINDKFTYTITLTNNGILTINIDDQATSYSVNTSDNNLQGWGAQNLLFHAGCYLHEHGSDSTKGGKVSFYSLNAIHVL